MLEFLLTFTTLVGKVDINEQQTQYEFLSQIDSSIITIVVDKNTSPLCASNWAQLMELILVPIVLLGGPALIIHLFGS